MLLVCVAISPVPDARNALNPHARHRHPTSDCIQNSIDKHKNNFLHLEHVSNVRLWSMGAMSCFWVAALLLALHSAAAVGPGSDMDSWMSSMIAKAPKVAKFNSTPSTLACT